MADDLGWEPIPGVAGASGCPHPTRLLTPICSRKRGKARQVDGAANEAIQIGGQAQRFLSAHDQINNLFHFRRDHVTAAEHRASRTQKFRVWAEICSMGWQ